MRSPLAVVPGEKEQESKTSARAEVIAPTKTSVAATSHRGIQCMDASMNRNPLKCGIE